MESLCLFIWAAFVIDRLVHEGIWLNLQAGLNAVAVLAPSPPQHQFWVKPCTGRAYGRAQRKSRQCRKSRARQSRVQAGVAVEPGDVAESCISLALFTTLLEACLLFVASFAAIVCFFNVLASIHLPLATVAISGLLGGADDVVEAMSDDGDHARVHRRLFLSSFDAGITASKCFSSVSVCLLLCLNSKLTSHHTRLSR
jgi:hypothetical protein